MAARAAERGTSLLDALISTAIVVTVAAGVGQLLVWARRASWSTGESVAAVALAVQKMEQLRSLAWYVSSDGLHLSDASTDLSRDPATAGGSGLRPAPAGTLDRDIAGFVDYVDAQGHVRRRGETGPPDGTAFVRRWAIHAAPWDPDDTLVLAVVVYCTADAAAAPGGAARHVRLRTLRTRTLR